MRENDETNPPWPGLGAAVGLLVVDLALQVAAYAVVAGLVDDRLQRLLLAQVAASVLLFAWVMQRLRIGWRELFHPSRASVQATLGCTAAPVLGVVPGLVAVNVAVGLMVETVFPLTPREREWFELLASGTPAAWLMICVLAPLVEEMLFRGVILRGLLGRHPRWTAIVLSTLLFALAHANVHQFVAGVSTGLLLGWLYERTRSLWPGIVLHAAYNTVLMSLPQDVGAADIAAPAIAAMAVSVPAAMFLRRWLRPAVAA